MTPAELSSISERCARACAVAIGFSLPFSTALDILLLGLMTLFWVVAGGWRARWARLRMNPVAWVLAGYAGLLTLGLSWGERPPLHDGFAYFHRYAGLLYGVILITLFHEAIWRSRALRALVSSLLLLLLMSYLVRAGVLPHGFLGIQGTPANPVISKLWITHGILMACGAYVFMLLALHATRTDRRYMWLALALLAVVNVVFMTQGRTGYLVLAALLPYAGYVWRRGMGMLLAALLLIAIVCAAFLMPSALRERSTLAAVEFQQAQTTLSVLPDAEVPAKTSIGLRLEFYRNTLAIIRVHPWLGVGTGGFPLAYEKQVAGTGMIATLNPHEEYLFTAAQLGIPGLVALFLLLVVPWHTAARLTSPFETEAVRGLVLVLAVGCLFNTLLLDHTERLLFVWGLGVAFGGLPLRNAGTRLDNDAR